MQVPEKMDARLTLQLNVRGEFHLDDFTWQYTPLNTQYAAPARVAARIEQHRKGDFTMRFVDGSGAPLPAGALRAAAVSMKRHDWSFGTVYEPSLVRQAAGHMPTCCCWGVTYCVLGYWPDG